MFFDENFRTLVKGMLPAIIVLFVALMISGIVTKAKQQNEVKTLNLSDLFTFSTISDSFSFNMKHPTLLIYFNPDCEHCQYEARAIRDSLHRFAATNVLLVSDESVERLREFAKEYDLVNQPNIHILYDRDRKFKDLFGTSMVPSIFIYNQQQELVKHYKGETKIEAILKYSAP